MGRISALLLLCSCSLIGSGPLWGCSKPELRPGETEYTRDARVAYEDAVDTLDGGYYTEAIQQLNKVKSHYPFSQYAVLAELKIADAHFEREAYDEAVDAYNLFARLHPNSPQTPYALYRAGESYEKKAPEDWPFFPPAYENDQTATRQAVSAYRTYLERFPGEEKNAVAREKIITLRRMLAGHEMYVAEFYLKRDQYRAAALRLEGIRRDFTDLPVFSEALLLLGEAYLELHEDDKARDALNELKVKFPGSDGAKKADRLLGKIPPAAPGEAS